MEYDYQQVILPKLSGYLEKKGRKKMLSCYKRYWFVLEGRLLLYYKSKDDYDAISPCKGSIALGPTCNVKPCTSHCGVFQISSHITTITLRAETREEQHKWMQAIILALNQRNNNMKKLGHFRYSLGELSPTIPSHINGNLQKFHIPSSKTILKPLKLYKQISLSDESLACRTETNIQLPKRNVALTKSDANLKSSSKHIYENFHPKYFKKRRPRKCFEQDSALQIQASLNNNNDISDGSSSGETEHFYCEADYRYVESDEKSSDEIELISSEKLENDKPKTKICPKTDKEKKKKMKKSESFLQRMWLKRSKKKKELSATTSTTATTFVSPDTIVKESARQEEMLPKFDYEIKQKFQEEKKLMMISSSNETVENSVSYHEIDMKSNSTTAEEKEYEQSNGICPLLPLKCRKTPDVTPNNNNSQQSLDEILNDLNTERKQPEETDIEQKGKVKRLIKQFSMGKDDVELRKTKNYRITDGKKQTDSSELNRLLDELAKVTTAPIMTPGVTTSLINPDVSDTELRRMIPIRRKMSDPDYDVPRPHRSLGNLPKKDANALEATRFFGPVLKPSDFNMGSRYRPVTPPADYSNIPSSLTPDSLEFASKKSSHSRHDESYSSHNYQHYRKPSHTNIEMSIMPNLIGKHNNIYANPINLLLMRKGDEYNGKHCSARKKSADDDFIDSLET